MECTDSLVFRRIPQSILYCFCSPIKSVFDAILNVNVDEDFCPPEVAFAIHSVKLLDLETALNCRIVIAKVVVTQCSVVETRNYKVCSLFAVSNVKAV